MLNEVENADDAATQAVAVDPVVIWHDPESKLPDEYENVLVKLDDRIITGAILIGGDWSPTSCYTEDFSGVEPPIGFTFPVTAWAHINDAVRDDI